MPQEKSVLGMKYDSLPIHGRRVRSAPGGGVAGRVGVPAFEPAYLTPRAALGYFLALKWPAGYTVLLS